MSAIALRTSWGAAGLRDAAGGVLCAATAFGVGTLAAVVPGPGAALIVTAVLLLAELLGLCITGNARTPVVWIPVVVLNLTGILGFLLYRHLASSAQVSAALPTAPQIYDVALRLFIVAAAAFAVGAFAVLLAAPHDRMAITIRPAQVRPGALLITGWLPLLVLLMGKGASLLQSQDYLAHAGPAVLVSVGNSLTPVAVLALAVVLRQRGGGQRWALLGLGCWVLVLFSIATRGLALVPSLLLLAGYISPKRPKLRLATLVAVGVATIVLLNLVLTLRQGTPAGYGLGPFVSAVVTQPGRYLFPDLAGMAGNFLFAVPLAGQVATSAAPLPHGALWTSLSPLPGGMTDWAALAPHLRVNYYTPFSGIGELGTYGYGAVAVYFVAAGALFAVAELSVRSLAGAWRIAARLTTLGLAALFTLDMLQYNLRSGTRLLWYLLAALLLLILLPIRASLRARPSLSKSHGIQP